MKTKTQLSGYCSPMLNIVELFPEGILCGSDVMGKNNTIESAILEDWNEI